MTLSIAHDEFLTCLPYSRQRSENRKEEKRGKDCRRSQGREEKRRERGGEGRVYAIESMTQQPRAASFLFNRINNPQTIYPAAGYIFSAMFYSRCIQNGANPNSVTEYRITLVSFPHNRFQTGKETVAAVIPSQGFTVPPSPQLTHKFIMQQNRR